MNRYGRGPTNGPSKATASTLCQKCLKRDTYECKAVAQERPYVSRPSRTQQLLNPKLVPKLNSDVPQDLLRKKGIADEQLAKAEQERGRKRERQSEDPEVRGASKRMRSASASSSASVSSISTNLSGTPDPTRSPTPHETFKKSGIHKRRGTSVSLSPPRRDSDIHKPRTLSISRSPLPRASDLEKKRRRDSVSSMGSYTSEDGRSNRRSSRDRAGSRSTRRKFKQVSPPVRGRRTESRSPQRGRRRLSHDRQRVSDGGRNGFSNGRPHNRNDPRANRPIPRERSLSPFSKRLALTQAMSTGR